MNIAMIGYYPDFEHKNIENIDYRSLSTILDYDMLIINFKYLFSEYQYADTYNGISILTEYDSQEIVKDIFRRKTEFKEFLETGRNIVVISPYKDIRMRYTGEHSFDGKGKNARQTNYVREVSLIESLPIEVKTTQSIGTKIELYEKNFEKFFNKYKDNLQYDSYFDIKDCNNPLINVARTSKIVANYEKYEKGIILFFPNHHFEDSKKERAFFNDIYELMNDLNTEKKEKLPQWIENYNTEEEKNTKLKLSDLKDKVATLNKDIAKTQDSIEAFKEEKRIFIESGDVLENIVKEIFDKMGYKIIKFGGNQEDLVISHNNETFVIEIKGLDGSAAEKNAAQALKWKTNYYIDTGIKPKGVLIVNAFKNKELKDRGETFPNQMLKYAEHEEICLLSSVQLYNIYNKFLENEISKEEITEDMKNTNGIYAKYKDWNMFLENNSK